MMRTILANFHGSFNATEIRQMRHESANRASRGTNSATPFQAMIKVINNIKTMYCLFKRLPASSSSASFFPTDAKAFLPDRIAA